MWSHEIDNGSNGSGDGDSLVAQNVACPACERASGIWDARHVFNANAVYQLPFGAGKPYLNQPGIVADIAGHWQATSTLVARTGFPVNVLINRSAAVCPTATPPISVPISCREFRSLRREAQPSGNGSILLPSPYRSPGTWGMRHGTYFAGRAHGRSTWELESRFRITERVRHEFRAEFFNIFNHPQYGLPQATFGVPGFGSIMTR